MLNYYCFKHNTITILENSPDCSNSASSASGNGVQEREKTQNKTRVCVPGLCMNAISAITLCTLHSCFMPDEGLSETTICFDPLHSAPSEHSVTAALHKVLCTDAAVSQIYTVPQFSKNNRGQEMLSLTSSLLYSTTFSGISEN